MALRGQSGSTGALKKVVEITSSYGVDERAPATQSAADTSTPDGGTAQNMDELVTSLRNASSQFEAQQYAKALKFWRRLPGGSADLSQEATSITDTIFGEGYDSMFPGLITGGITANAIIKGIPGYVVKIRQTGEPFTISFGTVADTGMKMDRVGTTGAVYRFPSNSGNPMDNDALGVTFDPNHIGFVFRAVGSTANIMHTAKINYLFGEVDFGTQFGGGEPASVYAQGSFVPLKLVGRAQNYNLTQTANPIDETDFDTAQANDGRRRFVYGLRNVNLELSGFWRGANNFLNQLEERKPAIISLNPDGEDDAIVRGIFYLMRQGQRGDVGALEEESVNFELNVSDSTDNDGDLLIPEPLQWRYRVNQHSRARANRSVVSIANQRLLDAWLRGCHLGVRYLPDGSDTDNDVTEGYTSAAIVTDASLSSSLDGVAEFQASLQLDGHLARRGKVIPRVVFYDDTNESLTDMQLAALVGGTNKIGIKLSFVDRNGEAIVPIGSINPPTSRVDIVHTRTGNPAVTVQGDLEYDATNSRYHITTDDDAFTPASGLNTFKITGYNWLEELEVSFSAS